MTPTKNTGADEIITPIEPGPAVIKITRPSRRLPRLAFDERIGEGIERLRKECRWTVEQLAEKIRLNPRTVQRHLVGKTIPYSRHITAYERVFSKHLNRKVVIGKMP